MSNLTVAQADQQSNRDQLGQYQTKVNSEPDPAAAASLVAATDGAARSYPVVEHPTQFEFDVAERADGDLSDAYVNEVTVATSNPRFERITLQRSYSVLGQDAAGDFTDDEAAAVSFQVVERTVAFTGHETDEPASAVRRLPAFYSSLDEADASAQRRASDDDLSATSADDLDEWVNRIESANAASVDGRTATTTPVGLDEAGRPSVSGRVVVDGVDYDVTRTVELDWADNGYEVAATPVDTITCTADGRTRVERRPTESTRATSTAAAREATLDALRARPWAGARV